MIILEAPLQEFDDKPPIWPHLCL